MKKMGNLTYWKWLRSIIKIPDKTSFYGFIFVFGGTMAILTIIIGSLSIVRGYIYMYVGILICLLLISIGVLVSLYGWFNGNVKPFQR